LIKYSWNILFKQILKHKKILFIGNFFAIISILISVPTPLFMPVLIDEIILDKAIENKNVEYLKKLLTENLESVQEIEIAYVPREDEVIIDVREEAEIKKKPLILENIEILKIPFININSEFKNLDQTKTYLFYCEK